MWRKPSAPSLISDSGPEDSHDFHEYEDGSSSIYMAAATSSGNVSDVEKEPDNDTPDEWSQDVEDDQVTEGTSLLLPSRQANPYGGISLKDDPKDDQSPANNHSVPSVVYASPVKPHLPSPSASNSRVTLTSGLYLPYNWRTPAMVSYDVQAHPFNRAPSANPQMTLDRNRYTPTSESEGTGESSRASVWSVELESGSCGCISGLWNLCFGKHIEIHEDTHADE